MAPTDSIVYLDNAATTRVAPEVAQVVTDCMREDFGNPSSAHRYGIAAERRVKQARAQLLDVIGDPDGAAGDLIWTSGGTEGDALGVVGAARTKRGRHLLHSAIEHPAVRESAGLLTREGWQVEAVPVTAEGTLDVDTLLAALTDDTALVALMLVNNEIGTLLPVAEAAAAIHHRLPRCHVHCDAVQALGKVAIDVTALGVDSIAFAGHKLHGPKGVGALWLKKGVRIAPLWAGGGQQKGLRSGTLNVPGIAGMGAAAALAAPDIERHQQRWREMADRLLGAIAAAGIEHRVNGAGAPRAGHVLSVSFADTPAEPLLHAMEARGILVSAGSACAERSHHPSPVLDAIGVGAGWGTLRLSFGRDTTPEMIDRAAGALMEALAEVRG